jgi:hypothetical protein
MNECKFKFTQDGKCVGYERWAPYGSGQLLRWWRKPDDDPAEGWRLGRIPDNLVVDAVCPFVCLDRNKKEVYAGDNIKWWAAGCEHDSMTGTVEWCPSFLRWTCYSPKTNTMYSMRPEGADLEIELIEDQP